MYLFFRETHYTQVFRSVLYIDYVSQDSYLTRHKPSCFQSQIREYILKYVKPDGNQLPQSGTSLHQT